MKVFARTENVRIVIVLTTYVALHFAWLKQHTVINRAVMLKNFMIQNTLCIIENLVWLWAYPFKYYNIIFVFFHVIYSSKGYAFPVPHFF